MSLFLGADTSNYTTSVALYDAAQGTVRMARKLLPVKEGQKGLRQSDAVYLHLRQLPSLFEEVCAQAREPVRAVGVSVRPRDAEGSYMPCFEAGQAAARAAAAALQAPAFSFSHQAGHVAAALWSARRLAWLSRPFIAFHVSGGTTEAVLCTPGRALLGDEPFAVRLLCASLDLKAGQAIDRVGVMLGLSFPAGPALEALSRQSGRHFAVRPSMKGGDCSLSGVENRCRAMREAGEPDADVARFCMDSVIAALSAMAQRVREEHPGLPLLFAGGVTANADMRAALSGEGDAVFAEPAYSSDNAAGVAVLAAGKAGEL